MKSVFPSFCLRSRLFTWVRDQPTSEHWKLGFKSFSFCKYLFASSAVFCLATRLLHPCWLSPTLNTCIKWGGQLDGLTMHAQLNSFRHKVTGRSYKILDSNLIFMQFIFSFPKCFLSLCFCIVFFFCMQLMLFSGQTFCWFCVSIVNLQTEKGCLWDLKNKKR